MKFNLQHTNQTENTQIRELFSLHRSDLRVYGLGIVMDQNLVDDAIQELFLKFCENQQLVGGIRDQKNYLKLSLRRELLKAKEGRKKFLDDNAMLLDIAIPSYEEMLVNKQRSLQASLQLKKSFALLSNTQKSILTLKFYKGMSYEEIADKLSITKRTVYNHVHDAMKKIRSNYQ